MPGISALIITLNEERNIQRCIDSLINVVDEIVVLDTGSSDRTCELAIQKRVRVFSTDWKGYSQTKNEGHKLLNYDWVLSLDADEALSSELQQSILKVKDHLNGVYRMPRLTNYCGQWIRHGGWYPDKKIRLYQKHEAFWKGDFVHEQLYVLPDLCNTDLKGDILHFSYYSVKEHLGRAKNYAELGAKKIIQQQESIFGKSLINPLVRFIKMYFVKAGFLDGWNGLVIASISSFEVFLKYKKAGELRRDKI